MFDGYCQVKLFGRIFVSFYHLQVIDSRSPIQQNPSAKRADSAQLDSTLGWNPELDEPVLKCRIEPTGRSVFTESHFLAQSWNCS